MVRERLEAVVDIGELLLVGLIKAGLVIFLRRLELPAREVLIVGRFALFIVAGVVRVVWFSIAGVVFGGFSGGELVFAVDDFLRVAALVLGARFGGGCDQVEDFEGVGGVDGGAGEAEVVAAREADLRG